MNSFFIYISVYICSLFLVFFYQRKRYRLIVEKRFHIISEMVWFMLISVAPIILATIRKNVGADTEEYRAVFRLVQNSTIKEAMSYYMEKGYMLLNVLAVRIFDESYGIFLLSALLVMILLFVIIHQYKKELSFSMVYFLFFVNYFHIFLNISRQSIAALILLVSVKFLFEKKWINYIFLCIFATLFHTSALVWILVLSLCYFLRYYLKKHIYMFIIICSTAPIWMRYLQRLFELIFIYVLPDYLHLLSHGQVVSYGYYLYILPPLVLIYFLFWKKVYKNEEELFYYALLWSQIPFQAINVYAVDRMSVYPAVFQIILIPRLLQQCKVNKKIKYFLFILWYLFKLWYMEFYMNGNGTAVYQTIFS